MKIFISPRFDGPDKADGGIRRVVEAQRRYLPDFGIEVVDRPEAADVINCHAGDLIDYPPDKPLVASSHGLYWSNYKWQTDCYIANQMVIENMVRSKVVTAPSNWVAQALRRGIYRPVIPIYHGVDEDEWGAGENGGYMLWNKARSDPVSDVHHMLTLAKAMPSQKFLSTIGPDTENVHIIGKQPYEAMKPFVQNAGLYLSTARETFGIGTLEAMACGVPVVGWDFGGNAEIIIPGETGYLAPFENYEALVEAVQTAFAERDRLSANCLADVRERWGWTDKIAQYAEIFSSLWAQTNIPRPRLSIIVTCYNLGRYLNDCLSSVLGLPFDDWECIIVDDKSTDDTRSVARRFCEKDERFVYREPEANLGLSGARNFGFECSSGEYVLPLDADDMLTPAGVMPLIEALDGEPDIHIAYGNLLMMSEDGVSFHSEISEANEFNWLAQMAHINQPFYCAMMRREVLRDSGGGYRQRDWRAEDAAMWCRVTSFGFRAKKVTDQPTIFYRLRSDSKGAAERAKYPDGDGDWCAWYGWRIASNYQDGQKALAKKRTPPPELVPFGAQGKPPSDIKTWNIDHHQDPLISVIIPVGPGHERYIKDALDSLTAQTFASWEAIVINDSGQALDLSGHAWATIVNTEGGRGAGHARNQGLQVARGDLVYFLDGDDWLLSNALHDSVQAFIKHGATRYIYTNYVTVDRKGKIKHERLKPYNQRDWHGQHAINALMWRQDALGVGGFDEELPGWEDWDFAIKCALNGICGELLPVETFVYRGFSGQRRDLAASSMNKGNGLLPTLKERYQVYYTGEKEIMSCGCRGNGAAVLMKAKLSTVAWATVDRPEAQEASGMTRMVFIGMRPGSKTYERVKGQLLRRKYRGGNNSVGRYINADPSDIELLKATGEWAIAETPQTAEGVNLPAPVVINYEAIGQEVSSTAAPQAPAIPVELFPVESYEATPKAIELAQKKGIDLATVTGSGANGKITLRDVRNATTVT